MRTKPMEIDAYKEARSEALAAEDYRIDALDVLTNDQKSLIKEAVKYAAVPYLPASVEFIQKYILAHVEYPTLESKLVQALTELSVRVQNLATRNYEYQKGLLEIEELQQDVLDTLNDTNLSEARKDIRVRKFNLEIANKQYQIGQSKIIIAQVFTEFMNWKEIVETCLRELGKSIEEIDWTKIKVDELNIKTAMWAELAKQGMINLTPSQIQAILSNPTSLKSDG